MRTVLAFILALFFSMWSNRYFGGNWFPKSDAELIADGMVIIMVLLVFIIQAIDARGGKIG